MPSDLERLEIALENAVSSLSALVGLMGDMDRPCKIDPVEIPPLALHAARGAAAYASIALEACAGRTPVELFIDEALGRTP